VPTETTATTKLLLLLLLCCAGSCQICLAPSALRSTVQDQLQVFVPPQSKLPLLVFMITRVRISLQLGAFTAGQYSPHQE
jgi:hypothetical protein